MEEVLRHEEEVRRFFIAHQVHVCVQVLTSRYVSPFPWSKRYSELLPKCNDWKRIKLYSGFRDKLLSHIEKKLGRSIIYSFDIVLIHLGNHRSPPVSLSYSNMPSLLLLSCHEGVPHLTLQSQFKYITNERFEARQV